MAAGQQTWRPLSGAVGLGMQEHKKNEIGQIIDRVMRWKTFVSFRARDIVIAAGIIRSKCSYCIKPHAINAPTNEELFET